MQRRLSIWAFLCVSVVISIHPGATRAADRPAATATPATQAGHGADVYRLRCMPCHGDRGQGLTDEFRLREYPPEDVDCWKSGCHGERPYDNGFTIPRSIPAIIGPGTLTRFATAADLHDFVSRAMPFNAPGSLSEDEYLQLASFLLEQNDLTPASVALSPLSLSSISLHADPQPLPASLGGAALAGIVILSLISLVLRRLVRRLAPDGEEN